MTKTMLKNYAKLTIQVGANVQKDQGVLIYSDVGQHEFVDLLVKEAYKAKAKWVRVEWTCQSIFKLNVKYQKEKTLSEVRKWEQEKLQEQVEILPAKILVLSEDPDGLNGINQNKLQKVQQNRYKITKKYTDLMENKYKWAIVAAASPQWAKRIFPNDKKNVATKKLWDAIMETVYVTKDNDPIKAWEEHDKKFEILCKKLNDYKFEYMEYKSKNGTDFRVWLIPTAKWLGGGERTISGEYFNPNLPTEEIYTSPMKGRAEGKLVSTKPLSYHGQIIDNFSITFKNGRAVEWSAEKGEDVLTKMLTLDEGAAMLGEIALVPCDSPISKLNILFYNTLFDENASCHVALGRGFSNTLDGYEDMTKEQTNELGINDSMIHVDFMIGCDDLNINGYTKDKKCINVFKNGNWEI